MENKILVEYEIEGEGQIEQMRKILDASGYSYTVRKKSSERKGLFDISTSVYRVIVSDAPVPETIVEFSKETEDGPFVPIIRQKIHEDIANEQRLIVAAKKSAREIMNDKDSYTYLCSCYGTQQLSEEEIIENMGTIFNSTFAHVKNLTDTIDRLSGSAKQMQRIVEYIAKDQLLLDMYSNFITDPEEKERFEKTGQVNANHVAEVAHEVIDRIITSFKEQFGQTNEAHGDMILTDMELVEEETESQGE